jgi:site-specific recombinase XerD
VKFLRFVRRAGRRHPREIDLSLVDAYFSQILPGRSRSFVSKHVAVVTGYLHFVFLTGVHPRNLAPLVETPVSFRQARLPRTIEKKDIQRVLSEIDPGTPKGRRDRAMFLLLVVLGLRPQEVSLLRTRDVDLDRGSVRVPSAKSSPERRVPLPPVPRSAIAEYLRRDRPADAPSDRLFLCMTAPWRPFRSGSSLAIPLGLYFARAGLTDRGITVYALRHAFAQRLMERKVSLAVIRDLMGHRSIETTCLYLKVDLHHLREVARLPAVHHLAGLLLRDASRLP